MSANIYSSEALGINASLSFADKKAGIPVLKLH